MHLPVLACRGTACDPAEVTALLAQHGALLIRQGAADLEGLLALSDRIGCRFVGEDDRLKGAFGGNLGRELIPGHRSLFRATDPGLGNALPLHGELYHQLRHPPGLLWFYCHRAGPGETWLCDGAELFAALPEPLQRHFSDRPVAYARYVAAGEVGALAQGLRAQGGEAELVEGELRTRFEAAAVIAGRSGPVFINNVLPFALRELEEPAATRARVRFADGEPIPPDAIRQIEALSLTLKTGVLWRRGDILLVDNQRILHGRPRIAPGARELWLRMSERA